MYVATCELLNEEYNPLPAALRNDSNVYTLGRVSDHYVIIACLPTGRYGIASAATVAKDMLRSFESIRVGLMVEIEERALRKKYDIRLSDIIMRYSVGRSGGVHPV